MTQLFLLMLKTVCNYGPQGNVLGEFNSEISPPLGHASVHASIS